MDSKKAYEILQTYRAESPCIWGLLRGNQTTAAIAKLTLITPSRVAEELDKDDSVISTGDNTWGFDSDHEDYEFLIELKRFSKQLYFKFVQWEAQNPANGIVKYTPKQEMVLGLLAELGQPFTTLEAAQVQGFSKSGYTKPQLMALVRKGALKMIPNTRPQLWQLVPRKYGEKD